MTGSLRAKQGGVARGMSIGFGAAVAAVILWVVEGRSAPLTDRLAMLGTAACLLGIWLAAGIGNVARLRFFSAAAIDAGSGGADTDAAVVRGKAILQNTLEQAALAILAYGALAVMQERARLLIALLVALFSIGRLLFWTGYARGAAGRAAGFALTFYPSVAALFVALAALVRGTISPA